MADDPDTSARLSRRHLLQSGTVGVAGLAIGGLVGNADAATLPGPSAFDVGTADHGKVELKPESAPTEAPGGKVSNALPPEQRVGFAVVGLGRLALEEIMPAFSQAKFAKPVALVSGSPDKARAVAAQYGIRQEAIHGYDRIGDLKDNPEVKVVYIVTPNALHHDEVIAAAAAGKHVLCEKPMAISSAQGREMVAACAKAGVKLMIAYRSQYQPHHRFIIEAARSGRYGRLKLIEAVNNQNQGELSQWRLKKALAGGGALPDVGVYCMNAARYITGEEPVEVTASLYSTPGDPRFREVEETVNFHLRFPSGVMASCTTSYGVHRWQRLFVHTDKAAFDLAHAFAYQGQQLTLAELDGEYEREGVVSIPPKNQFAAEIDHMAECVMYDRRPRTPGEEGVQDHVVIEAIYEAARTGQVVKLPEIKGLDVTRGPQLAQGE